MYNREHGDDAFLSGSDVDSEEKDINDAITDIGFALGTVNK